MLPRMANTWLAKRVLASALVHCSLIFVLLGSISVLVSSWMLSNARNSASDASSGYVLMFLGIWFMGTGYANHYSMLLVSMTQHGELTSQQSGMFGSSTCFGITMGLWLAGFVDLAHSSKEVAIAMLLTAIWTAHIREFPICDVKPKPEVVEVPSARVDTSVPLTRGNSKSSTGGWHADGRLAAAGRLARGCQPRSEQQAAMSATLGTTGIVEGDIPSSPSKSRKCQLPKAGSPGMEGNLRIASIEQFLQKGDNCWRGWGKLGRRTLTKLEDEQCCHVLPLL
eukprot:g28651.t1